MRGDLAKVNLKYQTLTWAQYLRISSKLCAYNVSMECNVNFCYIMDKTKILKKKMID